MKEQAVLHERKNGPKFFHITVTVIKFYRMQLLQMNIRKRKFALWAEKPMINVGSSHWCCHLKSDSNHSYSILSGLLLHCRLPGTMWTMSLTMPDAVTWWPLRKRYVWVSIFFLFTEHREGGCWEVRQRRDHKESSMESSKEEENVRTRRQAGQDKDPVSWITSSLAHQGTCTYLTNDMIS